MLFQPNTLLS